MRVTILTNGPGELWGWVRPVASELRNRGHSISLWLLPCPFSSGHEREAASLLGVDKLEGPSQASVTWRELEHERTDRIIQLGGDIAFGLRMSKFSNAPLTVYSYRHRKALSGVNLLTAFPGQVNFPSVKAIGDLVKDSVNMDSSKSWDWYKEADSPRILFLPGSRPKIRLAVIEWLCELRDKILRKIPGARFRSLFPQFMPEKEIRQWQSAGLNPVRAGAGVAMRHADYALTQPGTNNFELMHCGLPGLVVAPERFLKFMPVSGVAGLFAGLPLVGKKIRKLGLLHTVNKWNGYISLPNRTFQREILSELWGNVDTEMIAERLKTELADRDRLRAVHDELLKLSGEGGAACRLCDVATGGKNYD